MSILGLSVPVVLMAAAGAAALSWLHLQDKPRLATGSWIVVLAFVPVWLGVSVGFYWFPAVLAGLFVLTVLVMAPKVRPSAGDAVVGLVFLLAVFAYAIGTATFPALFGLLTECVLGYFLGRLAVGACGEEWLGRCIAVVFTVVAVLALVEFVTGFNPFVQVSRGNGQYALWGVIQERGGQKRAEVAFGHSIALGSSLALALPFVIGSTFRERTRLVMTAVILLAAAVTFSRTGLVGSVLAVVLSLVLLRGVLTPTWRIFALLVGGTAAAVVTPLVLDVFTAAGDEAAGSAAYRGDLLSLIPTMSPFGESQAAVRFADGTRRFGQFRSIDNELVLFGLQFGWIPLAAAVVALAVAVAVVLLGKARPATVAVVCQLPALASVALITQYRIWFFFVVGVAVASQAVQSQRATRIADARGADAATGSRSGSHLMSSIIRSGPQSPLIHPRTRVTRNR